MLFPALLAKLLSAGAVAQAATGAGVVLVVATGAGAGGLLGTDVQDTITAAVGADSGEVTTDGDTAVSGDAPTADPAQVDGTDGDITVPVQPLQETLDPEAWVAAGPGDEQTFGEWVSLSAHNDDLRQWLRAEGKTFGSMVSEWARKKHVDLSEVEGIEDVEGIDDSAASATPTPEAETETEHSTEATHGNGRGNGGNGGNSGRGHN